MMEVEKGNMFGGVGVGIEHAWELVGQLVLYNLGGVGLKNEESGSRQFHSFGRKKKTAPTTPLIITLGMSLI